MKHNLPPGLLFIILMCCPIFLPGSMVSAQNVDNTNSVIMVYRTGDFIHYQITETGVYKVWGRTSDIIYQHVEIADLNQDGRNEAILFSANEGILVVDLETGQTLWRFGFLFGNYRLSDVGIGDLTNDGELEIAISRFSTSTKNVTTDIFSSDGIQLTAIESAVPQTYTKSGSDNIEIADLDQDGINELYISYGSVMWIGDNGSYILQSWSWTGQEFELNFDVRGSDIGGNRRMIALPNHIITGGWYNNHLRAFDSQGSIVWQYQLFNTDEPLYIAEPEFSYVVDDQNNPHLMVFSQNYWNNMTMIWVDLNPLTGEVQRGPTEIGSTGHLRAGSYRTDVFYAGLKQANLDGEQTSYFQSSNLQVNTDNTTTHTISDDNNRFSYVSFNSFEIQVATLDDIPYMIVSSNDGRWLVNSQREKLKFSPVVEGLRTIKIVSGIQLFESAQLVNRYHTLSSTQISLITVLSLVLLISSAYFGYNMAQRSRFDRYFGKNWRENFKIKMDQIIQSISHSFTPDQLPPALIKSELLLDQKQRSTPSEVVTSDDDTLNYKLIPTDDSTTIFELLNTRTDVAKDLKVGDMAILIEILSNYPDITVIQNIISKFQFSTKSTIYKRIEKLEALELINNVSDEVWTQNIGNKVVKLTEVGLQLLSIIYSSLAEETGQ